MKCLRRNDDAMKTMAGISTRVKALIGIFFKTGGQIQNLFTKFIFEG